jgi:glycolate oxidase iron-sulfur subunit
MEGLFAETNRDTESVLARNGFALTDAPEQGCCGALHAHSGQLETARELARKNIDAFESVGCGMIVTNAAGCGAAMKEYGHLLKHDDRYSARAAEFASRVRDIFELLAETGVQPPAGKISRNIAYDAPCHLIHAQRIASAPVQVMKEIPGLRLVPLEGFESCCGGAGIYNLQHPELSRQILTEKLKAIEKSGADTVATANPGCIMQIGAGALLEGLKIDVVHPIELLDAAYQAGAATPERTDADLQSSTHSQNGKIAR